MIKNIILWKCPCSVAIKKCVPYFLLNSEGGYSLEILVAIVHTESPVSSHQDRVSV